MLRSVLFVCFVVFLKLTQPLPILEEDDIYKSEAEVPFKDNDNAKNFMNENAEAIRKVISEQEFAIPTPDQQEPFADEHEQFISSVTSKSNPQNLGELDEDTKEKCKYYYELFQQKYDELQDQLGSRFKNVESEGEEKIEKSGDPHSAEAEIKQTNKYDVKVNNYDAQSLPYPEMNFFNPNPDKSIQKPNSKGPVPENVPMFMHNGYQYVPLADHNYVQPSLESNPVEFNKEHPQYMKLSPLTLQNSLVSDGKTVYYWYKTLPNYEIYLPVTNNHNTNINEKILSEVEMQEQISTSSTSTSTSTTTTTEASTTTTEASTTSTTEIATELPAKIETSKQPLYEHKLKFVYPIQYPKPDIVNVAPWDIDPYAYYPRELQPDFMNVQMSYVPTFHMIKQLTVPNEYNSKVSIQNPSAKSY